MQNRIRELRKKKGMTMKELGRAIGVAESTISQYETGKRQPDNATLLSLAQFLGVTVDCLLGASPAKPQPTPRSQKETELLELFEKLTPEEQTMLETMAQALIDRRS